MRRFSVFEHGLLPVGEGRECIATAEASLLLAAAQRIGIKPVNDFVRWESPSLLRFGRYVGVFALDSVQIEVLPKVDNPGVESRDIDRADNTRIDDTRLSLLRMLAGSGDIPLSEPGLAAMAHGTGPLLERLGELFVRELLREAARGLPHAYQNFENDLPVLRGRLDVVRQATRLAADPSRMACRYHEFTNDIPINRVLKVALERLRAVLQGPAARSGLLHGLAIMDSVTSLLPSETEISRMTLGRAEKRLELVFSLAKLIVAGLVQDVRGGSKRGFALLWDMPMLFERFVGRRLMGEEAVRGRRISLQSWSHLANLTPGNTVFHLRPDIICRSAGTCTYVADTKWKRLDFSQADLGVADADCYQLVAYAQAFRTTSWPTIRLVYPTLPQSPVGLVKAFRIVNDGPLLEVHTISIETLMHNARATVFQDGVGHGSPPRRIGTTPTVLGPERAA